MGIVLGAAILGALIGGLNARRRGGRPADIAQYAVAFGIAFALAGVIVSVILARVMLA